MARVVSLVSLALASNAALNNRPIVGIAGVPNDLDPSAGTAWIPASYVKYIEAAGARVVPIPYDAPLSTTLALLKNINGVLFTGGSDDFFTANGSLTTYALTAQAIFKESVDAAAQGETWPLWGTCLGFQILGVAGSDFSRTVLTSGWDSENISLPVKFTAAAASSRVFGSAPGVVNTYATQSVALNAHHDGISPAAFAASGPLSSRFTVLATSVDRKGAEFVASFEGNTLPIYATQWHPEKQIWEWNANEDFVHTYDSIQANRYLADFFVNQTRLNNRSFSSPDVEAAALIYNYPVTYTFPVSPAFEQSYFFTQKASGHHHTVGQQKQHKQQHQHLKSKKNPRV